MPVVSTNSAGALTEPVNNLTMVAETIAAAGTVIGNATAIGANVGLCVVTGADDAKGVILPTAQRGKVLLVYSNQAGNGLKLYPPVNSTLNDGSANSALVVEGKTLALCVATNSTNWGVMFTLNT